MLNPISKTEVPMAYKYNHQELGILLSYSLVCNCGYTIRFFANYAKTEEFRTSELPCVPINSIIAVILNPILRYLRPSGAEISNYKFTRSRDHLNRENEILHHYLKLCHQLFWIQHHKIDQKTLRTAGALEMHTKLSGLLE